MNYETKARPIRTIDELRSAFDAEARVEYTACGNRYDIPPHYRAGSGGWIPVYRIEKGDEEMLAEGGDDRWRAFYPITASEAA